MSEEHPHHSRVQAWVDLPRPADEVWAVIGPFAAIAEWHPSVASAEIVEIDGDIHRHLRLVDDELILERLIAEEPRLYRYEMVETPLPVENYHATFACTPHEGGCRVFWTAVFDPLDPRAEEMIRTIQDLGLEGIRASFAT